MGMAQLPTRVPSEAGRAMNGSGAVAMVGTCRVTHLLNNRVGRRRDCKERGRKGEGRGGEGRGERDGGTSNAS